MSGVASQTLTLQNAATADGNGTVASTDGWNGAQIVDIQKTGTGTTTATIEGSVDQTTWYGVGFQPIDAQATLTRSVTPISIGIGSVAHAYQVLDRYPALRVRLSTTAGAVSVTAKLYATSQ